MPATGAGTTGRKWGGGTLTFACYSGSDYLLEFKSLNFATGEPGKVQIRDLVRVVGIVAPFAPRVSVPGEIRFIEPQGGKWAQETCAVCPVCHGRARQSSGTGPCGDCIRVLWVPGPRSQYSGKIRLIAKPGEQDEVGGGGMGGGSGKRSSDTRVAYPEVKIQVRDLVRVVGILAPFDQGGSVPGKNSFYRVPGGKWAQETCAVWPQQQYATGEPGKVQGRDRVGIVEGSCGYRTSGVSIRGKFILSRNLGTRRWGSSFG